jgi:hypothetical protein
MAELHWQTLEGLRRAIENLTKKNAEIKEKEDFIGDLTVNKSDEE